MRENRKSGSEGGEPQFTAAFLPLSSGKHGKHGKQDAYPTSGKQDATPIFWQAGCLPHFLELTKYQVDFQGSAKSASILSWAAKHFR